MAEPFAPLSGARLLELLPQQEPFRFVDEILEVDADHIVARYTFRRDADFYRGHFPGNPITPGVLLIEAMAQTGVVALGIHDPAGVQIVRRPPVAIDRDRRIELGVSLSHHGRFVAFACALADSAIRPAPEPAARGR